MDYVAEIQKMQGMGFTTEQINYALSLASSGTVKGTKQAKPELTAEEKKAKKADYEAKLVKLTDDEHQYLLSHALEAKAQYVAGSKGVYTEKQRLFGFSSPFALKNIAKSGMTTPEYKATIGKMLAADQAQSSTAKKRVAVKSVRTIEVPDYACKPGVPQAEQAIPANARRVG